MADDSENTRIRALREKIELDLNMLRHHLRTNTRPDKTFPIEPILSSAEVDLALMRYPPETLSRMAGNEVIAIDDSDDEVEVVKKGDEVVVISDDEESEQEERGRKRLKLDYEGEVKDVSMLEHGVVEKGVVEESQENSDDSFGMTAAEMEDHAERVAFKSKYGDSDEDDSSDSSSEKGDSSDEDDQSRIDNQPPPNFVFGQTPRMETSATVLASENGDIFMEEQRKIRYKPATENILKGSRKSRKQKKKQSNHPKPITSTEQLERLAKGAEKYEKHRTGDLPPLSLSRERAKEKTTMSVLEKVAVRRQRKLDRGEQLPEALDMFPGVAGFDSEVQASSKGGQFGDDFVSFGDTKEIPKEPIQNKTTENWAPATEVKKDFSFVSFSELDYKEAQQGSGLQDGGAFKVEGGVRISSSKKRRRPA